MLWLKSIETKDSRALYAHMKRDFPADERPPSFVVKREIAKKTYTALYLMDDQQAVGYAVVVAPPEQAFALVLFLAILPEVRGAGYGGKLLKELEARFQGKTLALEVEDPEAAKDEGERHTRERRVRFYERAGFRVLPTARAKIFGVDMRIMVNTRQETGSVRDMMQGLYGFIMPSPKWLKHIDVWDVEGRV